VNSKDITPPVSRVPQPQKLQGNTVLMQWEGEMEHTYRFFSIATDLAGNSEAMKTTAEAVVLFSDEPPVNSVVVSPAEVHVQKGKTQQFAAASNSRKRRIDLCNVVGQQYGLSQ